MSPRELSPVVGPDGRMITAVVPQTTLPEAPEPDPYADFPVVEPTAPLPEVREQPEVDPYAAFPIVEPAPSIQEPLAPVAPVAPTMPALQTPEEKNWQDALMGSEWMTVLPFVGSAIEATDSQARYTLKCIWTANFSPRLTGSLPTPNRI